MAKEPKPDEVLSSIDYKPPRTGWMDTPVEFKKGTVCFASKPKNLKYIGFPNPR